MSMKSLKHICLAGMLLTLVSCGAFSNKEVMPGRNETYSYLGPGSSKVERGNFPKIYFSDDSAVLTVAEENKLDEVISFLGKTPTARLLIVGFAHDHGTDEYNRVLGEQRAQAVRAALIEAGCSKEALQTLSFGSEESARSGQDAHRVELGIVR